MSAAPAAPVGAWSPTRAAGLARLEAFVPRAGREYARKRNFDLGAGRHAHVSGLSPWLRHRLVLESEAVAAAVAAHGDSAAAKFIDEVCWRTYWKGWLECRPGVWHDYLAAVAEAQDALAADAGLRANHERALAGRTGIDCFDAWVGELLETGYLHNHARMWFASIWIFTLRLPWALGADLFLRHLLDGDAASNTLSWRWVGGLHTRGKTYLARAGNIAKYTAGRFPAPTGLAGHAAPLNGAPPPAASAPPQPAPLDHAGPVGLLLTEEDLHPGFVLDQLKDVAGLAVLKTTAGRSRDPVAAPVHEFVDGALASTAEELSRDLGRPPARLATEALGEQLVEWARSIGVDDVVTAYVPAGPARDALAPSLAELDAAGVRLRPLLRPWDALAWPHARSGFFRFRRVIPDLVALASRS
ncbi:MAG: FAD-binding domain-containing protein [Gammaproteobacteria bacterium]